MPCAAIRSQRVRALEPDDNVNWALLVEYDGGPFIGLQSVDGVRRARSPRDRAANALAKGLPWSRFAGRAAKAAAPPADAG